MFENTNRHFRPYVQYSNTLPEFRLTGWSEVVPGHGPRIETFPGLSSGLALWFRSLRSRSRRSLRSLVPFDPADHEGSRRDRVAASKQITTSKTRFYKLPAARFRQKHFIFLKRSNKKPENFWKISKNFEKYPTCHKIL